MENVTTTDLYAQAQQQWREIVDLGLHGSEDIISGIMPLLVRGLGLDPDHLPSLDLLSDILMELGAYDEAVEFAEKMRDLAPDEPDYQQKLTVLVEDQGNRRRAIRTYLRRKRLRLAGDAIHR